MESPKRFNLCLVNKEPQNKTNLSDYCLRFNLCLVNKERELGLRSNLPVVVSFNLCLVNKERK